MKKIFTCALIGTVALSYANADMLVPNGGIEQLKKACEESSKTVWVERNQVCIPKYPCGDSDPNIEKYCNKTFKDAYIQFWKEKYYLADLYWAEHLPDCRIKEPYEDGAIICSGGKDYIQFDFPYLEAFIKYMSMDDFNEQFNDSWIYVFHNICEKGLGGKYNRKQKTCTGITPQQCVHAANAFEPARRYNYIDIHYSDNSGVCIMKNPKD